MVNTSRTTTEFVLYLLDGLLHPRRLSINPFLRDDFPGEGVGFSDERLKPIAEICGDLCGVQSTMLRSLLGTQRVWPLWRRSIATGRWSWRRDLRTLIGNGWRAQRGTEWVLRIVLRRGAEW